MKLQAILLLSLIGAALLLACDRNPYKQGQALYDYYCASCHMEDGTGLQGIIPPLANADYVKENQAKLACIIRNGQEGEVVVNGITYNQPMPGISALNEIEITNVINYINHAWGNDYGYMSDDAVERALQLCK